MMINSGDKLQVGSTPLNSQSPKKKSGDIATRRVSNSKDLKQLMDGIPDSELGWFQFENRIRTLIMQLLDPVANK